MRSQGGSNRERSTARKTNDAVSANARSFDGLCPAEALAKADRVRQNRVVPTPVAGAKLSVARSIQPDQIRRQAGSDGDKNEFVDGESTA